MPPPLRAPLLRSSAELALRHDERGERLAEGGGDVGEARHQPIYNFYFDLFKVCIQILENRRVQFSGSDGLNVKFRKLQFFPLPQLSFPAKSAAITSYSSNSL
ncbi:hypothetical protein PVAP13_5KG088900 [Panicum virgatum]|uniref:Uncharacterized protein n=1 Tax=Panicum virgatum TaxID=38727 RepID=A0A8T0SBN1_PANVG|nr:hypothetical protein PVAP13_5KG088900 [Panicum virgatum]